MYLKTCLGPGEPWLPLFFCFRGTAHLQRCRADAWWRATKLTEFLGAERATPPPHPPAEDMAAHRGAGSKTTYITKLKKKKKKRKTFTVADDPSNHSNTQPKQPPQPPPRSEKSSKSLNSGWRHSAAAPPPPPPPPPPHPPPPSFTPALNNQLRPPLLPLNEKLLIRTTRSIEWERRRWRSLVVPALEGLDGWSDRPRPTSLAEAGPPPPPPPPPLSGPPSNLTWRKIDWARRPTPTSLVSNR